MQSNPSSHYELGRLYSYRSYSYFLPILTDFYKTILTRLLFYTNILTGMGLSWENILTRLLVYTATCFFSGIVQQRNHFIRSEALVEESPILLLPRCLEACQ